jgi:hypothetical protein
MCEAAPHTNTYKQRSFVYTGAAMNKILKIIFETTTTPRRTVLGV